MSRWADVEGVAFDSDGFELTTPRMFETIKDAKQWLREVSSDRGYWVRLAESETFPDEISEIRLVRSGDVLLESSPSWIGGAQ